MCKNHSLTGKSSTCLLAILNLIAAVSFPVQLGINNIQTDFTLIKGQNIGQVRPQL